MHRRTAALPLSLLCAALVCTPLQAGAADTPGAVSASQVQALVEQADALMQQNQYEAALGLLQRAYMQAAAAPAAAARNVLNSLANLYYSTGQLEAAARYYRELGELDTASGDEQGLSVSLFNLAHTLAAQGDHAGADAQFRRSLQLSRQLGDVFPIQ